LNLALVWGLAIAAQIYRYYRRSTLVQRQQTKWVVAGIGAIVALLVLPSIVLYLVFPADLYETAYSLVVPIQGFLLMFIPATLGISILRYRLWDIDVLIRRTLQYTLLTGLLALMYFGGVVVLQGILGPLTGESRSPLVTVVTTLAIAALFTPLRTRVQQWIDRRFYRKKYDAERSLARFAAAARDEVDMDRLSAALLDLVAETIRPDAITLWLGRTGDRAAGRRAAAAGASKLDR
jgi:hypothetical protein